MNCADFPRVMTSMAEKRTLPEVLRAIVNGIAACPNVALARIWLIEMGDLCATCRFRDECPDQSRCLHLVASAGNAMRPAAVAAVGPETASGGSAQSSVPSAQSEVPMPGVSIERGGESGSAGASGAPTERGGYSSDSPTPPALPDLTRIDGAFRRFPLGVRKVGRVAASGQPLLLPGIRGDEDWIADPAWFAREGIHTFAAHPLLFHGQTLGVLALFDRAVLGPADFEWLRVFADHAAVSIANANAFEEIAYLKERLEEENTWLREEVSAVHTGEGELLGTSPALRKVRQQIELVAPTDATVLITGESGTGKELVARAIHEHSARRTRPMVKVNCGAVPDALFESEFFGHVRGAFTGAVRDKPGRFELADGGTLFLDEIGEVPLTMQVKLLRVLQEQEIERVGDTRTRKVNVRIIAATNRDLKTEVAAGRFRQDLYYRLSVFPIDNPPLRERLDDLPLLAAHFVEEASRRHRVRPLRLTPEILERLAAHDWPGNVRELQNAIERAVIIGQGESGVSGLRFKVSGSRGGAEGSEGVGLAIGGSGESGTQESRKGVGEMGVQGLRFKVSGSRGGAEGSAGSETRAERQRDAHGAMGANLPPRIATRAELRERERENIVTALQATKGKVFGPNGAAVLLGMKPTTLASRIKALGLRKG